MGKSARVLGWEFGRTAAEMNVLLKQYGYLFGEPGAYGLTEKGHQFGDEQHHTNGYGGYAYRQWETRTWKDETAAALLADMEANPDAPPTAPAPEFDVSGVEPNATHGLDGGLEEFVDEAGQVGPVGGDGRRIDWKKLGIAGAAAAVIAGGIMVAPHVKPFWHNKVKPATRRARSKLTRSGPDARSQEPPEGATDSTGAPDS